MKRKKKVYLLQDNLTKPQDSPLTLYCLCHLLYFVSLPLIIILDPYYIPSIVENFQDKRALKMSLLVLGGSFVHCCLIWQKMEKYFTIDHDVCDYENARKDSMVIFYLECFVYTNRYTVKFVSLN